MATDLLARCPACGGLCVPTPWGVLDVLHNDERAVVCICEECGCAETVRKAADALNEVALEQAEVVRARTAGVAQSLRETGVVLRTIDVPQPERIELRASAGSN